MSKSTLVTHEQVISLRNAKVAQSVQITVREQIPKSVDEKIKVTRTNHLPTMFAFTDRNNFARNQARSARRSASESRGQFGVDDNFSSWSAQGSDRQIHDRISFQRKCHFQINRVSLLLMFNHVEFDCDEI